MSNFSQSIAEKIAQQHGMNTRRSGFAPVPQASGSVASAIRKGVQKWERRRTPTKRRPATELIPKRSMETSQLQLLLFASSKAPAAPVSPPQQVNEQTLDRVTSPAAAAGASAGPSPDCRPDEQQADCYNWRPDRHSLQVQKEIRLAEAQAMEMLDQEGMMLHQQVAEELQKAAEALQRAEAEAQQREAAEKIVEESRIQLQDLMERQLQKVEKATVAVEASTITSPSLTHLPQQQMNEDQALLALDNAQCEINSLQDQLSSAQQQIQVSTAADGMQQQQIDRLTAENAELKQQLQHSNEQVAWEKSVATTQLDELQVHRKQFERLLIAEQQRSAAQNQLEELQEEHTAAQANQNTNNAALAVVQGECADSRRQVEQLKQQVRNLEQAAMVQSPAGLQSIVKLDELAEERHTLSRTVSEMREANQQLEAMMEGAMMDKAMLEGQVEENEQLLMMTRTALQQAIDEKNQLEQQLKAK